MENMNPFNYRMVMPVSGSPNILQKQPNPDFSFVSPLINNQNSNNLQSQLNLFLNQKQATSNLKLNKPSEITKQTNITNEQLQQLLSMQFDLNSGYLNSNMIDWSILNNPERCLQNKDDLQWVGKLNKELWWNVNKLVEMVLMKNSIRIENQMQPVIVQNQIPLNNVNNNINNNNFRPQRKVIGNNQVLMPVNNPAISPNNHMSNKYYPSQIQTPNPQFNQSIPQQLPQQQQQQQQLQKPPQFPQNNYINQQQQQQQYQNSRMFGRVITNNRGFAQRIQN